MIWQNDRNFSCGRHQRLLDLKR